MNTVPNRPRRLCRSAGVAVALVAVGTLAGCGGGSDGGAGASATAPTATTVAPDVPATGTAPSTLPVQDTTPVVVHHHASPTTPGAAAPDHLPAPPAAVEKQDQLPAPSEADTLVVKSSSGTDPKWRVAAQMQGKDGFCVVVTSLGASNPAPDCQSGTQLALAYFSDQADGQASANVAQIRRSVRNPPADILISGTATADVSKVVIDYRHKKFTAKISPSEVSVPVDRKQASTLTGESAAKMKALPNPLRLRIFGLSIPQVTGNPPTQATSKAKHPVNGVMTLELQ